MTDNPALLSWTGLECKARISGVSKVALRLRSTIVTTDPAVMESYGAAQNPPSKTAADINFQSLYYRLAVPTVTPFETIFPVHGGRRGSLGGDRLKGEYQAMTARRCQERCHSSRFPEKCLVSGPRQGLRGLFEGWGDTRRRVYRDKRQSAPDRLRT